MCWNPLKKQHPTDPNRPLTHCTGGLSLSTQPIHREGAPRSASSRQWWGSDGAPRPWREFHATRAKQPNRSSFLNWSSCEKVVFCKRKIQMNRVSAASSLLSVNTFIPCNSQATADGGTKFLWSSLIKIWATVATYTILEGVNHPFPL